MTVRCAIYTRKSTEEGLEQDFNSLDAQREACEAYVQSQKGLGWRALRKRYDDGGISGGTLDRPALQDLLKDIEDGAVDLVIVYKVDRLTRSLMDFAKIIEAFDEKAVSFVSVTQQFNTADSMGRLTLNVLLSFAQFEREVTAERIRDKIAASKKKGIWMGGLPPLGYDAVDKKLVINKSEAETVRRIFRTYLDLGAVRLVKEELDRSGIVTKRRVGKNGRRTGGNPFSRGNLYQLLSNPLYIGQVRHQGKQYPGEHEAIIEKDTWEAAQTLLNVNAVPRTRSKNVKGSFLLTSLVFDESGEPLYQSQAHTHGKRYCYYVSKHLTHDAGGVGEGWRVPAVTLETVVSNALAEALRCESKLTEILGSDAFTAETLKGLRPKLKEFGRSFLEGPVEERRKIIQTVLSRVEMASTSISLSICRRGLAGRLGLPRPEDDTATPIKVPIRMQRRGVETKLVIDGPNAKHRRVDPELCRLIGQSLCWFEQLTSGEAATVREIARREKVNEHEITRVLHLAFLSPKAVEGILDGRQAEDVTVYRMRRLPALPFDWREQAELLENLG